MLCKWWTLVGPESREVLDSVVRAKGGGEFDGLCDGFAGAGRAGQGGLPSGLRDAILPHTSHPDNKALPMTIRLALLGAGRIGAVHARSIAVNDKAALVAVAEPDDAAAQPIISRHGAQRRDIDAIAASPDVDGVILCTPTDLHASQIEQFARAGKAIFCEKPIDLNSERVRACLAVVESSGALLMLGFNRRYDPHFMALKQHIDQGKIGAPEMGVIISRDPAPPPSEYIRRSGGIFKDMMIHDLDMAIFLMGGMPREVMATASVLTDPSIADLGDYDSATALLRWEDGRQLSISNSRRASYGYDQRIEIHGSAGMLAAENQRPFDIELATADGYLRPPLHNFFMTRYVQAYANEMDAFIAAITDPAADALPANAAPIPTGRDGLNALLLAEAALASVQNGKTISVQTP